MYTIYGPAASRAFRCFWTLCETGDTFQHVHMDLTKGEAQDPSFLEKNPMGKVPVLEYDGHFIFESGAICTFIAQRAQNVDLLGMHGSLKRALVEQWLFFSVSELEQPLWNIRKHTLIYPPSLRAEKIIDSAKIDFKRAITAVRRNLVGDYLVGDQFSLADIFIAQTLFWANQVNEIDEDLSDFQPYLSRLKERKGFPHLKDYLPKK